MTEALLSIEDLQVQFEREGERVYAVQGISFDLRPGEVVALVGESGCGKTVAALSLMGLLPSLGCKTQGRALFQGRDLLRLSEDQMRKKRGREIAMIFQDPMACLNPTMRIGTQIAEGVRKHRGLGRRAARGCAVELLDWVGITEPERRAKQYPHQFSGGMLQRAMIAMALACKPKLLIADEPTTALDVTVQDQILDLLARLQRETAAAILLITHDLGLVAGMCERVLVMYAGKLMEEATVDELFYAPKHPYTQGLLRSLPQGEASLTGSLRAIPGSPPELKAIHAGCPFAPRCPEAIGRCAQEPPPLPTGKQRAACWLTLEELDER